MRSDSSTSAARLTLNKVPRAGTQPPVRADLYSGAAGVAFFLHEVARLRNDAHALKLAQRWCDYARTVGDYRLVYGKPYVDIQNSESSVFLGKGGVAYVDILLACLAGNERRALAAISNFEQAWQSTVKTSPTFTVDLFYGAPGFACSARDVRLRCRRLPTQALSRLQHIEEAATEAIIEDLGRPLRSRLGVNMGLAHGITGQLFVGLNSAKHLSMIKARLNEFVALAVEGGDYVIWPRTIGSSEFAALPGSWCNGTAGMLLLFCKALRVLRGGEFRQVAERLAWTTFRLRDGAAGPLLCCGTSGQALALASYASDRPQQGFRRRASDRIRHAANDCRQIEPLNLWQGTLGVELAGLLFAKKDGSFPILEAPVSART